MHYFILTLVRHSLEKGKTFKFDKCGNHVKYILAGQIGTLVSNVYVIVANLNNYSEIS